MRYRFDDFEVDTERFELRRAGEPRPVEPLVFDLIAYLVRNPNRLITRDDIIEHVWKGRIVSDATISGAVKSARRALDDSGDNQARIGTVRGRGFRFLAEVSRAGESEGAGFGNADRASTAATASNPSDPSNNAAATALGGRHDGVPSLSPLNRPVLAILPFHNLSAGVNEYFADGLTEDIITNLGRFRELLVIGRTSTFRYKGQAADPVRVAAELKATYVVEGSVRRAAGRVRITSQLLDASSGVQLWGDRYDRDMEDIFAVQDEVTRTIAATLGVKVQDAALARSLSKNPKELGAYECVLRARRYTVTLSPTMHAEARDLLEQAIALDPTYADAHALLANVYLAEHRFDANPLSDPVARAHAMAEIAVGLDPQNAYARCWLAIVHFFRRQNDLFEAEAERALDLNPNDPETLADIGHFYAFMGQYERGTRLSARAMQLNPLHPGWYHFSFARMHYHRRDYAEALSALERTGLTGFYWYHMLTAAALGQLGRPEAAAALARARDLKPTLDPRAELFKWNATADDAAHVLDGLAKAAATTG